MKTKFRQGDVLLTEISELPKGIKKKNKIIAYGEITGHTHRFESEAVAVFQDNEGKQFIDIKEESELMHEEHAHLLIPKGKYMVILQREVDLLGEVRNVLD